MITMQEIQTKVAELDAKLHKAGYINAWVSFAVWGKSFHVHIHYLKTLGHHTYSSNDPIGCLAEAEQMIDKVVDAEHHLARTLGVEPVVA